MSSTAIHPTTDRPRGYLKNVGFDLFFVFVIALVAMATGSATAFLRDRLPANTFNSIFQIVFVGNIWFLGYHHVVATYTRLCFDKESYRTHRSLILYLPFVVVVSVIVAAFTWGLWVLSTTYLYWQWFHYSRQSWGIHQVYRRKSGGLATGLFDENRWLSQAVFYSTPAWGILYRSWQDPGEFLFVELKVLPIPGILVTVAGCLTGALLLFWLATRIQMFLQGRLPAMHTAYSFSHHMVFVTGYLLIDDITTGWLVLNIWHNAQYIAFVWVFNNNRFHNQIDPQARFLSWMSQTRRWPLYLMICLAITSVTFLVILFATRSTQSAFGLPAVAIVYQAINFHHYVVDGIIWKVRKKAIQKNLNIPAAEPG